MDFLISKKKSTFTCKNLVDGVLVVNEVMSLDMRTKKEFLIFKVDFEKAYNSVNLRFLYQLLGKFRFGDIV